MARIARLARQFANDPARDYDATMSNIVHVRERDAVRVAAIAIYSTLLSLGGCATTPLSSNEAAPVSTSSHLSFKQASNDTVPVMVIRDSGFMGSACNTKVTVNGKLAALLASGEKVLLHIPVGEVFIGAEASGICAGGLVVLRPNEY